MHGNDELHWEMVGISERNKGERCCLDCEEVAADERVQHIDDLSDADVRRLLHQLLEGAPEIPQHLLPHPVATCSQTSVPFLVPITSEKEKHDQFPCSASKKMLGSSRCGSKMDSYYNIPHTLTIITHGN